MRGDDVLQPGRSLSREGSLGRTATQHCQQRKGIEAIRALDAGELPTGPTITPHAPPRDVNFQSERRPRQMHARLHFYSRYSPYMAATVAVSPSHAVHERCMNHAVAASATAKASPHTAASTLVRCST